LRQGTALLGKSVRRSAADPDAEEPSTTQAAEKEKAPTTSQDGEKVSKTSSPGTEEVSSAQKSEEKEPPTGPIIDAFFFIYWGAVAVLVALIWLWHVFLSPEDKADASPRQQVTEVVDGVAFQYVPTPEKRRATPKETELPQTMWSMIILSAIGQVRTESNERVPTAVIFSSAVCIGLLQLGILFLLLHDIDPHADAVTVEPSVPWANSWAVNAMKWAMCIVICVALSSEMMEIKTNLRACILLSDERLHTSRYAMIASILTQYAITLAVVWSAMAVVLSFQSCPDIIFSSLAVCFVSNMDDMYYSFVCTSFDLEVDFVIKFEKGDRTVPWWVHFGLKFAAQFPLLLGLFVVSRAFHSGVMPYARLQHFFHSLSH
jgi:hypothetical protein